MTGPATLDDTVPDSERRGLIGALPSTIRPLASLMRLDRPIGTWLLFWPCAWSVALAGVGGRWLLFAWLGLGAFAMRAAGCVYNDIVDRDLDAQVERTRLRPLASGRTTVRAAWALTLALCLVGLVVLLQFTRTAQLAALASIVPVVAYPYMKRITWWPQAWLGLTFNWGVLVGWTAVAAPSWGMALLYAAGVTWTLGYDTIYALQDIEDDALAGIKSSARVLGRQARQGVAVFYAATVGLLAAALWLLHPDPLVALALLPAAAQLTWQVIVLRQDDPRRALTLFRANRTTGLLVFAACVVAGIA